MTDANTHWRNAIALPESPMLSVLVPIYAHDVTPLLAALDAPRRRAHIEVILLDDASPTPAPRDAARAAAQQSELSVQMIALAANGGRSAARNRLLQASRAPHVLFLDADMIPDHPDFLDRWCDVISAQHPAVAFGGFTVDRAPVHRSTSLHRYVSRRSDCRSAEVRNADPAQFTTTSNLLVRRDVLDEIAFDEAFSGWGWEDVDWALRVHAKHPILHIDNTATHAGLDSDAALLRKAESAGANYRRLVDKHIDQVRNFRSFRAANLLKHLPLRWSKPALKALATAAPAPLLVRSAAYKAFRTLTYAEHLR